MAGQVQHRQLFSDIVPDLKLLGVLARLAFRNTDSLIGGVADALAREGITLLPSVAFLEDQLATAGPMTRRRPDGEEQKDVAYGESVARALAGLDLGQTAVVKGRAAVALEAMEGTDETIRRAGRIAGRRHLRGQGLEAEAGHALRRAGRGGGHARRDAGSRCARAGDRRRRARCSSTGRRSWSAPIGTASRSSACGPPTRRGPMPEGVAAGRRRRGRRARPAPRARLGRAVPGARLVGVHDSDAARAAEVAAAHGCRAYRRPRLAARGRRTRVSVAVPTVRAPRRRPAGARGRARRARREADDGDARRGRRPRRVRGEPRADPAGRPHRALQPGDGGPADGRAGSPLRRGAPARLVLAAQPGRRRGARPDGPRPRHRARARRHRSPCRSRRSAFPCSRRRSTSPTPGCASPPA